MSFAAKELEPLVTQELIDCGGEAVEKKTLLLEVMQRKVFINVTLYSQTQEEMPPVNPCRRGFKQSSHITLLWAINAHAIN